MNFYFPLSLFILCTLSLCNFHHKTYNFHFISRSLKTKTFSFPCIFTSSIWSLPWPASMNFWFWISALIQDAKIFLRSAWIINNNKPFQGLFQLGCGNPLLTSYWILLVGTMQQHALRTQHWSVVHASVGHSANS